MGKSLESSPPGTGSKKILVVDNHPVMLRFMSGLLTKEGHEVRVAEDGVSALDVLQTFLPDVVFIDLVMPNICGEKLCRIIRKMPELERARVVILSSIAADKRVDLLQLGADACIAKGPFDQMGRRILQELVQPLTAPLAECGNTGLHAARSRTITRELLAVNKHFEAILESMTDGIVEIISGGRIVYVNPITLAITGLEEEKLLASRFTELFHGEVRERIQDALAGRKPTSAFPVEESLIRLNDRLVRIRILPIQEERPGAIVILKDVTDRIRMEERLQHARKMEALGNLAGVIAHDFNNTLTVIMGSITLAKHYMDQNQKLLEKLEQAEHGALRARKLVQQILPLTRGGPQVRDKVHLSLIIRHTCQSIAHDTTVQIQLSLPEDLWWVQADADQIEQALSNLISNAMEAMEGRGTLRIMAQNVILNPDTAVPLDPGPHIRVTIHDQGSGIPADQLPHIFDPFFSTKGFGKGLGLATARSIIERHGGHIAVESTPHAGTTLHIHLPAIEAP